jgi:hypothetical protein
VETGVRHAMKSKSFHLVFLHNYRSVHRLEKDLYVRISESRFPCVMCRTGCRNRSSTWEKAW